MPRSRRRHVPSDHDSSVTHISTSEQSDMEDITPSRPLPALRLLPSPLESSFPHRRLSTERDSGSDDDSHDTRRIHGSRRGRRRSDGSEDGRSHRSHHHPHTQYTRDEPGTDEYYENMTGRILAPHHSTSRTARGATPTHSNSTSPVLRRRTPPSPSLPFRPPPQPLSQPVTPTTPRSTGSQSSQYRYGSGQSSPITPTTTPRPLSIRTRGLTSPTSPGPRSPMSPMSPTTPGTPRARYPLSLDSIEEAGLIEEVRAEREVGHARRRRRSSLRVDTSVHYGNFHDTEPGTPTPTSISPTWTRGDYSSSGSREARRARRKPVVIDGDLNQSHSPGGGQAPQRLASRPFLART